MTRLESAKLYTDTVAALEQGNFGEAKLNLGLLARCSHHDQLFASAASYGARHLHYAIRSANERAARNTNRTWVTY